LSDEIKDDGLPEIDIDELVRLQGNVVRKLQRSLLAANSMTPDGWSAAAGSIQPNVEALQELRTLRGH
jgi:hypothetical protein